MIGLLP